MASETAPVAMPTEEGADGKENEAAAEAAAAPTSPGGQKKLEGGENGRVGSGAPLAAGNGPLTLRHERLQGTISKYVPTSGWGFVRSHLFDGELGFKTESIMLECQNYEFKENEAVEFDVQTDERGRPHAVALKPMVGRKPSECIGQRHRGYVRRFADRWGFLNAAAFDGDLFVHRDNLLLVPEQIQDGQPPLRAGQAVEFDVALDDRGRTVAKQITTSALPRPCDWIGRRLHGYIRSFQGAWGFINSDRFAGDLFIHSDSVLPQYQGMELAVGTMVEFDVERDHHRKGGKNRLVARQVAVMHQPNGSQPGMGGMGYGGYAQADPMGYQPPHPLPSYGSSLNPQAATFSPTPPMYGGTQPMYGMDPAGMPNMGYQPPYPYPDPSLYGGQPMPPHHLMPPVQPGYGQMPAAGAYPGQPPPMPGQPAQPGQPPMPGAPMPGQPGQYPGVVAQPQPAFLGNPCAQAGAVPGAGPAEAHAGDAAQATAGSSEQPQVLLHITTHDWEPDQSGQLRVRKGTLINVSHRAAHGWVYAATVQPGGGDGEPPSEGWVPQAVAKRVSLCRVVVDWPAEGSGTLGLHKSDLIAVSKEAERGWVYGERIGPRRPDGPSDGWLPKKVLEYILV